MAEVLAPVVTHCRQQLCSLLACHSCQMLPLLSPVGRDRQIWSYTVTVQPLPSCSPQQPGLLGELGLEQALWTVPITLFLSGRKPPLLQMCLLEHETD